MRFRATLSNPSSFSRLVSSLSPLSKLATLKLKPDSVHLVCLSDGSSNCVQVWSQIANVGHCTLLTMAETRDTHHIVLCNLYQTSIFDEENFRLESNTDNEIYLEVGTEALARALKSAHGAVETSVKLTKKGSGKATQPALSLTIKNASRGGRTVEITQDVAVTVRKQTEIEAMKEPLCPTPDVNILLPPLASLRTVCERLKTISSTLIISANWRGELRIRAESDEAKVETEWRNLKHPATPEDDPSATQPPRNPEAFHSVTVDAKNFLKFLAGYSISSTTIACICSGHCLITYLYIANRDDHTQGGVLTYFIPGVNEEGDED